MIKYFVSYYLKLRDNSAGYCNAGTFQNGIFKLYNEITGRAAIEDLTAKIKKQAAENAQIPEGDNYFYVCILSFQKI